MTRDPLTEIHERLGLKRLNPVWAKLELFIGSTVAVFGLHLLLSHPLDVGPLMQTLAGGGLSVLGVYLAAAGHRSHLYQSNNALVALLLEEMRKNSEG